MEPTQHLLRQRRQLLPGRRTRSEEVAHQVRLIYQGAQTPRAIRFRTVLRLCSDEAYGATLAKSMPACDSQRCEGLVAETKRATWRQEAASHREIGLRHLYVPAGWASHAQENPQASTCLLCIAVIVPAAPMEVACLRALRSVEPAGVSADRSQTDGTGLPNISHILQARHGLEQGGVVIDVCTKLLQAASQAAYESNI